MSICDLFDKHRDDELNAAERSRFDAHLVACEECRTKQSLLNNVVRLMKSEEVRPLNMADQIARRAFQRRNSWASDVISWLRPAPALAALSLMIVLFSSLWIISGNRQVSISSELEAFFQELDADQVGALSQAHGDSELVLWLEKEGNSQ